MLKNRPRATSAAKRATTSPTSPQSPKQPSPAQLNEFNKIEQMLADQYGAKPRTLADLDAAQSKYEASIIPGSKGKP